jgi:hypothetical protein
VKTLSEQLSDLSDRAKKAEDVVSAARAKNRAALEGHRDRLTSSIAQGKASAQADNAAAQHAMHSWWDDTRSAVDERFAAQRAKRDEHRAERDLKKAENRADDAELDAATAIDFALAVLDQAEYAVVDAVIARADADDLALRRG